MKKRQIQWRSSIFYHPGLLLNLNIHWLCTVVLNTERPPSRKTMPSKQIHKPHSSHILSKEEHTHTHTQKKKTNRSDGKLIKKEDTLSEIVAKLKCGSYIWGAKDDAVCNSAFACLEKKKRRETKGIWAYISIILVIFFFGRRILYPGKDFKKHDSVINMDEFLWNTIYRYTINYLYLVKIILKIKCFKIWRKE